MEELLRLLQVENLTIGSCESLTAGLFTARFAELSGVSEVLRGGIVTYQSEVKTDLVGVDERIVAKHGVVSEQCARSMAVNARKLLGCDICVSFTGNAGPSVMEGKPVGCVYCAVAFENEVFGYHLQLSGSRNEIRLEAVNCMVQKLIKLLKNM